MFFLLTCTVLSLFSRAGPYPRLLCLGLVVLSRSVPGGIYDFYSFILSFILSLLFCPLFLIFLLLHIIPEHTLSLMCVLLSYSIPWAHPVLCTAHTASILCSAPSCIPSLISAVSAIPKAPRVSDLCVAPSHYPQVTFTSNLCAPPSLMSRL